MIMKKAQLLKKKVIIQRHVSSLSAQIFSPILPFSLKTPKIRSSSMKFVKEYFSNYFIICLQSNFSVVELYLNCLMLAKEI